MGYDDNQKSDKHLLLSPLATT